MLVTIQYKTPGYHEKITCKRVDVTSRGLSFKLITSDTAYTPEFPDGQKCNTSILEIETGTFDHVSVSER